jgi:hypothetical protein
MTSSVSPSPFSPNGDRVADTTRLAWAADEPASGIVRLTLGSRTYRSWSFSARTSWAATWDGRTSSGTPVPEGTYVYRVLARDAAGNRGGVNATVVVDRTASWLRWSRNFFAQDGDTLAPTASITFKLSRTATVTLRILDGSGNVVRNVWTGRALSAGSKAWTWNGRADDGSYVPQGRYVADLSVTSAYGTTRLTRPVWVAAFAVGLSASRVVPGQTLTVSFRTVEPLGTRPTVTFTQPGRAGVTVAATRLADGSYRAAFTVAAGGAGAGEIRITARDTGGRVNTMVVPIAIAS